MSDRIAKIVWGNCRRGNETIDLRLAARMTGCRLTEKGLGYLSLIEEIYPTRSRQVAAVAIANALALEAEGRLHGDSDE